MRGKRLLIALVACAVMITSSIPASAAEFTADGGETYTSLNGDTVELVYSGTGFTILDNITIPAGNSYKVTLRHDGCDTFAVWPFIGGEIQDALVNTVGMYRGTKMWAEGSTSGTSNLKLQIWADGDWSIKFATVTAKSTNTMTGNGDKVTGLVTIPKASDDDPPTKITFEHDGYKNCKIVMFKANEGGGTTLLEEIGTCEGETTVKYKEDTDIYFSVIADGKWTITVGSGGTETTVSDLT